MPELEDYIGDHTSVTFFVEGCYVYDDFRVLVRIKKLLTNITRKLHRYILDPDDEYNYFSIPASDFQNPERIESNLGEFVITSTSNRDFWSAIFEMVRIGGFSSLAVAPTENSIYAQYLEHEYWDRVCGIMY